MKVIFLDIDGVIATPLACVAFGRGLWSIDPTLAKLIGVLCERTGATLVISSTWRHGHSWSTFFDLFTAYGLDRHLFCDSDFWCTASSVPGNTDSRGGEINHWLEEYHKNLNEKREPVDNYLILDDDSDFTDEQKEKHFIKTYYKTGITIDDFDKAVEMLGKITDDD